MFLNPVFGMIVVLSKYRSSDRDSDSVLLRTFLNLCPQGQWRSNLFKGQGTMIHTSGVVYEGLWTHGRPLGEENFQKPQALPRRPSEQVPHPLGPQSRCPAPQPSSSTHISVLSLK